MERKVHPLQYGKHGHVNTRAIQGNVQPEKIDAEKGILFDVVLCQAMQPRGWAGFTTEWVWVEDPEDDYYGGHYEETLIRVETPQKFINDMVELSKQHGEIGHQCRFGHPNDCNPALGAYAGRIKNVRVRGNQAIGDIYLSDASNASPVRPGLKNYIMKLASEDTGAMMMSIVFSPGPLYFINAEGAEEVYEGTPKQRDYITSLPDAERVIYESITSLHFTDFVDQGANTLDMFRNTSGNISIAAKLTDFLDSNPQVWEMLRNQPDVVEGFTRKYNAYLASKNSVNNQMNKNQKSTQTLLGQLQKGIADLFRGVKNAEGDVSADAAKSIEATTDSGVAVSIETDADVPAVGDQVYLAGTTDLPPAGEHVLTGEFEGYTITTDDLGIITTVVAPEAAAEEAPVAEAAAQENAVDAEATTRQIEALAKSMKGMQDLLAQVLELQKGNAADLRSIKSSPFGQRVFPTGGNLVTGSRSASPETETEWARQQRIINEKKAAKAS
jgi:hypothetical protein